eukprot:3607373-Prymnesium_polylepis.1
MAASVGPLVSCLSVLCEMSMPSRTSECGAEIDLSAHSSRQRTAYPGSISSASSCTLNAAGWHIALVGCARQSL